MSVAELTMQYVTKPCLVGRQASFEILDQIKEADFSVSLGGRKTIFAVLAFSFIVLVSLYLYFAGKIVTLSIRAYDLQNGLNQALILSSEKESELAKSIYKKNSDFFVAEGYEKPLSIEVIRRSLNVVEIQQTRPLY